MFEFWDPIVLNFSYNGKKFEVGQEAESLGLIQLPDGTVLQVGAWIETLPPQPTDFTVVKVDPVAANLRVAQATEVV